MLHSTMKVINENPLFQIIDQKIIIKLTHLVVPNDENIDIDPNIEGLDLQKYR